MDYVRDQVAAREGVATERQRLMYAGKRLTRGDLTLEDYGVTQKSTLHLLGRVRGGMPEAGGGGLSSSKRPRLAFEDPMDVEAAGLGPLYAQWKVWCETCAPIATAFLAQEAKAAEALGYRERATRKGSLKRGCKKWCTGRHHTRRITKCCYRWQHRRRPSHTRWTYYTGSGSRRRNHHNDSRKNSHQQRQMWTSYKRNLRTW